MSYLYETVLKYWKSCLKSMSYFFNCLKCCLYLKFICLNNSNSIVSLLKATFSLYKHTDMISKNSPIFYGRNLSLDSWGWASLSLFFFFLCKIRLLLCWVMILHKIENSLYQFSSLNYQFSSAPFWYRIIDFISGNRLTPVGNTPCQAS